MFAGDQSVGFWVRCSTCGEDITRERPGIVTWPADDAQDLHVGRVDAVHKATACDSGADRWLDLDRFLHQLIVNSTDGAPRQGLAGSDDD